METPSSDSHGILLIDKPKGKTSFYLVARLRRLLSVKTIGHAGTLDPFATGVMVLLIGKNFTRLSDQFLGAEKDYVAELRLGQSTDSFDCDGVLTAESAIIPTLEEIQNALSRFQGEIEQIPPMFSAKKINGKKLYELAREGKEVPRAPVKLIVESTFIDFNYPVLNIQVKCSKGTYIRSIAHDLGNLLGCGAHLTNLRRIRSGSYPISECYDGNQLLGEPDVEILKSFIRKSL